MFWQLWVKAPACLSEDSELFLSSPMQLNAAPLIFIGNRLRDQQQSRINISLRASANDGVRITLATVRRGNKYRLKFRFVAMNSKGEGWYVTYWRAWCMCPLHQLSLHSHRSLQHTQTRREKSSTTHRNGKWKINSKKRTRCSLYRASIWPHVLTEYRKLTAPTGEGTQLPQRFDKSDTK